LQVISLLSGATLARSLHVRALEPLVAVVAVQALAAVAVLLLREAEGALRRVLPYVVSLAVGVLLGTGLAHLLPEAVEALGNRPGVWTTLLGTMVALYAFERIFHVLAGVSAEPMQEFEPHHADCEELHGHHSHAHGASRPATLLLGAMTHSFVDGASVAVAFAVDERIGWITALAIGLHEIPHRLGDFALLLHMGVHRGRAAALAISAGGSSLLGWALVAWLGASPGSGLSLVPWLLPVSAGSFVYIALVDLLPEIGTERRLGPAMVEILALACGLGLAIALTRIPGA
jgi:zinc and cadmium transporter